MMAANQPRAALTSASPQAGRKIVEACCSTITTGIESQVRVILRAIQYNRQKVLPSSEKEPPDVRRPDITRADQNAG